MKAYFSSLKLCIKTNPSKKFVAEEGDYHYTKYSEYAYYMDMQNIFDISPVEQSDYLFWLISEI